MGTNYTMSKEAEKKERELRAERLEQARRNANLGGAKALSDRFGWSINNYKAHESGRNGFGIADARKYAKAFNVSVEWLFLGKGSFQDKYNPQADQIKQQAIDLFDALPADLQGVAVAQLRALLKITDQQQSQDDDRERSSTAR